MNNDDRDNRNEAIPGTDIPEVRFLVEANPEEEQAIQRLLQPIDADEPGPKMPASGLVAPKPASTAKRKRGRPRKSPDYLPAEIREIVQEVIPSSKLVEMNLREIDHAARKAKRQKARQIPFYCTDKDVDGELKRKVTLWYVNDMPIATIVQKIRPVRLKESLRPLWAIDIYAILLVLKDLGGLVQRRGKRTEHELELEQFRKMVKLWKQGESVKVILENLGTIRSVSYCKSITHELNERARKLAASLADKRVERSRLTADDLTGMLTFEYVNGKPCMILALVDLPLETLEGLAIYPGKPCQDLRLEEYVALRKEALRRERDARILAAQQQADTPSEVTVTPQSPPTLEDLYKEDLAAREGTPPSEVQKIIRKMLKVTGKAKGEDGYDKYENAIEDETLNALRKIEQDLSDEGDSRMGEQPFPLENARSDNDDEEDSRFAEEDDPLAGMEDE